MRVACLTHYYIEDNRAGGELMLHALLSALAKAGHEVTAYITDTKMPDTTIDGVRVVYGAAPGLVLRVNAYDVVVTQFQNGGFAMESAKLTRKPLVYIVHNDMWQSQKMVRLLAPRDLALYNTNWIKDLNSTLAHELVVHPPIDRQAFKTKTTGEYVTLVNLTEPKGVDVFFELARRMPNTKFLGVVGGYWKGDQQSLSLPNLTIIENTANMRDDVYAKTKVIIMPSVYESFGMVAAEAIVSGIPVIAAPTHGLVENLGDAAVYVRCGLKHIDQWQSEVHRLLNDKAYYDAKSAQCLAQSKIIDSPAELKEFVRVVEDIYDANIRSRE